MLDFLDRLLHALNEQLSFFFTCVDGFDLSTFEVKFLRVFDGAYQSSDFLKLNIIL